MHVMLGIVLVSEIHRLMDREREIDGGKETKGETKPRQTPYTTNKCVSH